ncbi:MAG: hypothetical protein JWO78_186 [Micavibrio sp.]|nr:hypothetical protein [Micavibrio sp.]
MQAGDVSMRNTLQAIVPFSKDDSREAWFFRVALRTGIRKSRVKSLFYNRQCRLWGEELTRITGALQSQTNPMLSDLVARLEEIQTRQEALRNDIRQAVEHGSRIESTHVQSR